MSGVVTSSAQAEALAASVTRSAESLLGEHQLDRHGYCTRVGCGPWPCLAVSLAGQALRAATRRDEQRLVGTLDELSRWESRQ